MKRPVIYMGFMLLLLILAGCRPRPSSRYGAMMVYDSQQERMLLFGGRGEGLTGEIVHNDLWSFDMTRSVWKEITTTNPPPPRLSPGMVYDPERHQLVMFGGLVHLGRLDDTWILDLESGRWEQIRPPASPAPRSDMGFALDPERRIALLFSGYCEESLRHLCRDTWLFALDNQTWSKQDPIHSPPTSYGLRLVFDPDRDRFLFWGGHMSEINQGRIQSLGYGNQFWSYELAEDSWHSLVSDSGRNPQARYWHHLVYAHPGRAILLFSGDGGNGYLEDTWRYSLVDQSWERYHPIPSPNPRTNGAAAYDPVSGRLVLFGGLGEGFDVLGDTWLFSPASGEWVEVE